MLILLEVSDFKVHFMRKVIKCIVLGNLYNKVQMLFPYIIHLTNTQIKIKFHGIIEWEILLQLNISLQKIQ
jgi:hypothetical protein